MDNPLFGTSSVPSPDGNPLFSTRGKSTRPPSTAKGMRRLSDLNPWDLDREHSQENASNQAPQTILALSPLPSAAAPTMTAPRQRPEEQEFADILTRCMRGEMDASDAVLAYADACRARAADLRDVATSHLQRAPRFAAFNAAADELDAEAATWSLLWHLHGIQGRDFPAGVGGEFVEGAGFAKTFRHHAADLLFQDDDLNRAARTVAWLEALAAETSDTNESMPFSATDGLWKETKARIAAGTAGRSFPNRDGTNATSTSKGGGGMVTELDPDAPTRQLKRLHPDNYKDDDRLMSALWRLVRSGKVGDARLLCEDVGQPWRAVSLGGGGPQGPLPLGPAAAIADSADPESQLAETLAVEVEGGTGVLRALWKWSCYQAAEKIVSGAAATGGGLHEAAVYAVMSGHLNKVLPVCKSWEDRAWAYFRCWLDSSVDRRLGISSNPSVPLSAPQALATAEQGTIDTAKEALEVMRQGWPNNCVADQLPGRFEDVVAAACSPASSSGSGVAPSLGSRPDPPAAARHRKVQTALILDQIEEVVRDCLVRWIIDGVALPSESDFDAGPEGPACPPGLIRFAAHLALAMWALEVASTPEDGAATAAYTALHDLLQRLVQVYAVHLVDSGAHDLVPPYACHLRSGLRHATYLLFMEHLVSQGDFEACRRAHKLANEWFAAWQGGDMAPQEMAIISEKAISKAHLESIGGPLNRAWALRWLCFHPSTHATATCWANTLCREFALGGEGGVLAAQELLTVTMPQAAGDEQGGLEVILSNTEAAGVKDEAQELRCWALYFELQTEYLSWQRLVSASASDTQQQQTSSSSNLLLQTIQLLQAGEGFLKEDCLSWLAEGDSPLDTPGPLEAAIVVGPHPGTYQAPQDVTVGLAYSTFSDEERQAAAEAMSSALSETAARHGLAGKVTFATGDAPDTGGIHLPGLISVVAECDASEKEQGLPAAVLLLALALKGELDDAPGSTRAAAGALAVANLDAPRMVTTFLCRSICFPRVALMCLDLRRAAAEMGHIGNEGRDVVLVVADTELTAFLSKKELQLLLVMEREASVLQMRNKERKEQGGNKNEGGVAPMTD